MRSPGTRVVSAVLCGLLVNSAFSADKPDKAEKPGKPSEKRVAAEVDRLLDAAIKTAGGKLAPQTSDADFLRRVTLDLAGRTPSARDLTLFALEPSAEKRAKQIDRLLDSDAYSRNWARYWRDVVMTRATDMRARIVQRAYETWLVEQFRKNRSWNGIVTDLLTATGDVREKGEVALIFAHNGDAKEIAAETSRIFLGIQIQCANCHDHPTDVWKREQFHALAAYFPRVAVRPVFEQMRIRSWEVVTAEYGRRGGFSPINLIRRWDKNRDGKLTADEVKGTPVERGFRFLLRQYDRDGDGAISTAEVKKGPRFGGFMRRRRPGVEYYMPDLKDPSSRGRKMDPAFFVSATKSNSGMKDMDRRTELAKLITANDNKWFSRAYVNRIWAEMLGEGFYMPIDDLGPTRKARFENVLGVLADGFTASGYDPKWLFRTIANTQAYQRQIRAKDASDISPPFASASPTRLRADQIYDSLTQALGGNDFRRNRFGFGRRRRFGGGAAMMRYGRFNERFRFTQLFSFDPSTPQADIVGTVPQALYLMNSPSINNRIRATGRTRLGNILRENADDGKALSEVYLMVLSREPSAKERKICGNYIKKVGSRTEAFEDILWSLVNSSEFLTKR